MKQLFLPSFNTLHHQILIDSHRIKDILMRPTDFPCDEAKPKIQISTPIITQTQTQSIQNQKGTDRVK